MKKMQEPASPIDTRQRLERTVRRWVMDLERALEIVEDPSMTAYRDYVYEEVFCSYGRYETGFDDTYDEIAYAHALVAVELALCAETFVPDDETGADGKEQR
jgi:hypothetical protein